MKKNVLRCHLNVHRLLIVHNLHGSTFLSLEATSVTDRSANMTLAVPLSISNNIPSDDLIKVNFLVLWKTLKRKGQYKAGVKFPVL